MAANKLILKKYPFINFHFQKIRFFQYLWLYPCSLSQNWFIIFFSLLLRQNPLLPPKKILLKFYNKFLFTTNSKIKVKWEKILIDNCMPHNSPSKLDCDYIEYFPSNYTFILHPLNQGIIFAVNSCTKLFC